MTSPRTTSPRTLLADDHHVVLEGIKKLIEPEFDVVGLAEDGEELLALTDELAPELIVLDLSMPKMNGLEALKRIRAKHADITIVVLSMHRQAGYAVAALEAGASGYVLKHAEPGDLVRALHEALAGNVYVSPEIAKDVMRAKQSPRALPVELSERQTAILRLFAKGRSIKQIAGDLCISPKTVEYHKYRTMELLGIKTSAELVRFVVEQGLG